MSYCRLSPDSDVYLYASCYGGLTVHFSKEIPDADLPKGVKDGISFESRTEAIDALSKIKEKGYNVPDYALDRLREELVNIGDTEGLESDYPDEDDYDSSLGYH